MPTLTDPVELEEARIASTFTSPPPAIEVGEAEVAEEIVLADREVAAHPAADTPRASFRVIAEGDDDVGESLVIADAVALMDAARRDGKRHVAIVDVSTGALVDERDARAGIERA
jgi:hypothetical protein